MTTTCRRRRAWSPPVTAFLDALASGTPRTPLGATARDAARRWDGALSVDSAGAAVYESWLVHMADRTFHDKLGDAVYIDYVTNARAIAALYQLLPRPSDPWFTSLGDPTLRGRDAISGLALDDVARELSDRLGPDPAKWRWGAMHTITFAHALSPGLPGPARTLFDIGPYERAGDAYSLNNGAYTLAKPYVLTSHASERMVVDLGDLDLTRTVLPTGESGQPFSRYWADQTPLWLRGELHPLAFTRDRIANGTTLVLRPR